VPAVRSGRLVLSPHLDDAVLSCWHAIDDPELAEPVTVATVLAGYPRRGLEPSAWDRLSGATDPLAHQVERRAEDLAALACARAEAVHLPFVDEHYRDGPPPRRAVAEAIERLCEGFEEVWIPAAVGGHADHVLVADAALGATPGLRRFLYADLPYAAGRGWRALVDAALQGAHDDLSLQAQLHASPTIPPGSVPRVHRLSPAAQERKLAAIRLYRSQLRPLEGAFGRWFDDPDVAGYEVYWELEPARPSTPPWRVLAARLPAEPVEWGSSDRPTDRPFLSVVTRTRGDRLGPLLDVMAALAGQTCQDFEVVLVRHGVGPEAREAMQAALDALPPSLVERVRTVDTEGGGPGRPLNAGTAAARGEYVAVLDDDDLVTPDWVEQFRRLAARHPGQIARARTAFLRQEDGWWRVQYVFVEDFDLVDHLVINETAICGLAYPRTCFTDMGLGVDEELPVVEDWELLLQAAQLCGVVTTSAVTSFYRDWGHGDDSHSRISSPAWRVAERTVIARADEGPIVMPPGSASALREERVEVRRLREDLQALQITSAEQLRVLEADHRAAVDALHAAHAREVAEVRHQLHLLHRQLEETVEEFRSSASWRVTAPLRALGDVRARLAGREPTEATPPAAAPTPPPPAPAPTSGPAPAAQVSYPASYFEDLYKDDPDPWGFASRWYERRKYAITMASLPREHYRRVFEPACSIGVLTESLAARCDELVASDSAQRPLDEARKRLSPHPHVRLELMEVPGQWPDGRFDLVVLSEFAYFLGDADLELLVERTMESLDADGHVIAVHYLPAGKIVQSADEVHAAFRSRPDLLNTVTHREPEFVLDVFVRR
jgi:glycosyltransferase involved in cell wall biosynthesis